MKDKESTNCHYQYGFCHACNGPGCDALWWFRCCNHSNGLGSGEKLLANGGMFHVGLGVATSSLDKTVRIWDADNKMMMPSTYCTA
ncbi:hypothetical protein MKW98_011232 [Papaver atlanticum]|uniref:Uncharacterized protein n=1 Tax=Papaver atlanticum TaxID=357466 RepID=A0AAD4SVP0_9MAGN|nr:hypothetical protein MKW98_011232 [Papaver atlanticum]